MYIDVVFGGELENLFFSRHKQTKVSALIDENSEHAFGKMFSKAYLRHLFNIKEILGLRIASTLNLSYYISLTKKIQKKISSGNFNSWSMNWLKEMENQKGM